jgi:hypothetical protein
MPTRMPSEDRKTNQHDPAVESRIPDRSRHSRTHARYEAKVAEAELTMPQARALMLLSADKAMSMRALSDLLGANPTATRLSAEEQRTLRDLLRRLVEGD